MQARLLALGFWLLVVVQVAIPGSYYLRADARDDERFAWRMFSALRFRSCEVSALDLEHSGERALNLAQTLHSSWIGLLRRGRPSVIEKFLASRCAERGRLGASLLRSCREVDGGPRARERFDFECATRRLSIVGGDP